MKNEQIREEIRKYAALAFFASAYADQAEEAENPMQGEIMNQLPDEIDSAALHAADALIMGFESYHLTDIVSIFETLCEQTEGEGDREHTPEMFGHYAAMQAMGHGVGLRDAFGRKSDSLKVPYVEFGSYSLSKDYF